MTDAFETGDNTPSSRSRSFANAVPQAQPHDPGSHAGSTQSVSQRKDFVRGSGEPSGFPRYPSHSHGLGKRPHKSYLDPVTDSAVLFPRGRPEQTADWTSTSTFPLRNPGPIDSGALLLPADDCVRLNQMQGLSPTGPASREHDPKYSVSPLKSRDSLPSKTVLASCNRRSLGERI